ncbi:MAG: hypothetical protein SGPRY_000738 [Prymnesium sp.]
MGRFACQKRFMEQRDNFEARHQRRFDNSCIPFPGKFRYLFRLEQTFNPFSRDGWELHAARQCMRFQRLRHRFVLLPLEDNNLKEALDGKARANAEASLPNYDESRAKPVDDNLKANPEQSGKKPKGKVLSRDFDFSQYLYGAINKHLEHVMHLGWRTWCRIAVAVVAVFETAAFFGHYAFFLLLASGWFLFVICSFFVQHYEYVVLQMMPFCEAELGNRVSSPSISARFEQQQASTYEPPEMRDALNSLTIPSLVFPIVIPISRFIRSILGRKLISVNYSANYAADTRKDSHLSDASLSPSPVRISSPIKDQVAGGHAEPRLERLWPGLFSRRDIPPELQLMGENKQSILFLLKSRAAGHGVEDLREAIAQPAALLLQFILLASALYFTLLLFYRSPHGAWDWKVASAAFPVLMVNIFVTPKLIEPMILALNIEMFRDKKLATKVDNDATFAKFARAAKLLHGLESRAKALAKPVRSSTSSSRSVVEYFKSLEGDDDKYEAAKELKESFDVFDAHSDKSGSLSAKELWPLLTSMNVDLEHDHMQQLFEQLDTDKSGSVSFVELAEHMLQDHKVMGVKQTCEAIFDMIDTDGSGSLSIQEIGDAFEKLHTGMDKSELRTYIIHELDEDETGDISKEEFTKGMSKILEGA